MLPLSSDKFEMGKVVMTSTINNEIADNEKFTKEILIALRRYTNCDWGDLEESDKNLNDEAVKSGENRILAAFSTSEGRVYIITECDRSYTTILFCNEY